MADQDATGTAEAPAPMPFSQAILDAEAKQLQDHPEARDSLFSQSEMGRLIIDQETRTAEDFYAGRISQADYDAFRNVSQDRLDSLKEHVGEALGDLVADAKGWAADAKEQFNDFKQDHPGVLADLESGNPTIANAAAAAHVAGDVMEPLVEVAIHDVHNVGEVMMGEVIDTGQAIVEARADLHGVSGTEVQANEVRLEAATAHVRAEAEKFDRGMNDADTKVAQEFQQFHAQVDHVQEWAAQHPDAHVVEATMSDAPDVHQAVTHDAGET